MTIFPLSLVDGVAHMDRPVQSLKSLPDHFRSWERLPGGGMRLDETTDIEDHRSNVGRLPAGSVKTSGDSMTPAACGAGLRSPPKTPRSPGSRGAPPREDDQATPGTAREKSRGNHGCVQTVASPSMGTCLKWN